MKQANDQNHVGDATLRRGRTHWNVPALRESTRWLKEIPGAFGDLGTLLPLSLGLIVVCGASPLAVFLPAGLTALLAAGVFRIPMPVQPLKAACGLAIALQLPAASLGEVAIWMSVTMAILAVTGGAERLARLTPEGLVRGIQFGLGLLLIKAGGRWLIGLDAYANTGGHPTGAAIAVLPFLFLPQLPLTLGNVIAATPRTAKDYFGAKAKRVTPRAIAWTMCAGNAIAAVLGGMPVCHGSGGLTAHVKLGAKTWRAPVILGLGLLAAAMAGDRATEALTAIPGPVLGLLLLYVGVNHALLLRRAAARWQTFSAALVTGAVSLLTANLLWGMIAGVAVHLLVTHAKIAAMIKLSRAKVRR